jgi:hypothetical protein
VRSEGSQVEGADGVETASLKEDMQEGISRKRNPVDKREGVEHIAATAEGLFVHRYLCGTMLEQLEHKRAGRDGGTGEQRKRSRHVLEILTL